MYESINPEKYYSARSIIGMNIPELPWRSTMSFYKRLNNPIWVNMLKPLVVISPKSKRKYYHIKGKNLLEVIALIQKGNMPK